MMNCKQATRLVSQSQDRELSLPERIRLRFHLLMCSGCSNYNKQMSFIRKAMQKLRER
ncbi:MAG: zf-HC2 domain-containing protein [Gammaproteobacteria bacterium]|jgi:heterodisulfide reductase subunit B|nr:zf-HC2 domain-containing protein [Gammaproteobacteria bacterium]